MTFSRPLWAANPRRNGCPSKARDSRTLADPNGAVDYNLQIMNLDYDLLGCLAQLV